MRLRRLKDGDASLMLEWMHDEGLVKFMKVDFENKTLEDCRNFIKNSIVDRKNCHMAVVDDNDIYLGTVSLKNINNGTAEFAITMHKDAIGTGVASAAMEAMIKRGFTELGLNSIYWCVAPENKRAVRFYDKNGYTRIDHAELPENFGGGGYALQDIKHYIWYRVLPEKN